MALRRLAVALGEASKTFRKLPSYKGNARPRRRSTRSDATLKPLKSLPIDDSKEAT